MPGPTRRNGAPRWRDYVSIGLVAAAGLVFQIALTRVLSVVVWYHYAFLTISTVMLGLGVPGVWLGVVERPDRFLRPSLYLSGLTLPAVTLVVVRGGAAIHDESIAFLIVLILVPLLGLGTATCLLLMRARGRAVGGMYAADLVGAFAGTVAALPLLSLVPTPAVAALAGLGPLTAVLLQPGKHRWLAAAGAIGVVGLAASPGPLKITRSKAYDEREVTPVFEEWSATARITIFDDSLAELKAHASGFAWGRGGNFPEDQRVRQYWLEQDGSAGTPITFFDGDASALRYLLYDVTTAGLQVRPPQSVVVIGAGGGRDILAALFSGARDIRAVELNGATIDAVSKRFSHISGDIYHVPGVTAVCEEGRSYLTHTDRKFDLIQISLIDTWAASAAGAFALAENNLYTIEAFGLYLTRLNPQGLLSTSRWRGELPRLLILARGALRARGIASPEDHMLLFLAGRAGTLLVSPTPFADSDLLRAEAAARERGFEVAHPGGAGLLTDLAEGRVAAMQARGLTTTPPTDDRPYFFQVSSPFSSAPTTDGRFAGLSFNVKSVSVLRQAMLVVSFLSLLLFLLPFARRRLSGAIPSAQTTVRGSVYFASVGAGFMFLETVCVHRFVLYLGHPAYATTVTIAALLAGMGCGSSVAAHLGVSRLRRYGILGAVTTAGLVLGIPPVFSWTLGVALWMRVLITACLILPVGVLLGTFLPLGMVRFGDSLKPWLWAINGVCGVLASVMSLAVSMRWGFTSVGLAAAGLYLVAWLCLYSPNGDPAST